MNYQKFLHRLGVFLVIVFLTGCTVYAATPQPLPIEQGQPPQQPGQPQPGQPQPGQPGQQPEQPIPQPGEPGQQPGGQGPAPSQSVQIDQKVNIPGGGGSVEITFDISSGQWVHIQLTAGDPSMQPYGSMQYPDGASVDYPSLNTTANGMNQADILLTDNGRYTLTLFDGSNQGGPVSVKIVGSQ